jgi:hypothetical protein
MDMCTIIIKALILFQHLACLELCTATHLYMTGITIYSGDHSAGSFTTTTATLIHRHLVWGWDGVGVEIHCGAHQAQQDGEEAQTMEQPKDHHCGKHLAATHTIIALKNHKIKN